MGAFEPTIGQWWLPDQPEHRVSGYLDWEERDDQQVVWRLTLDGELDTTVSIGYSEGDTLHGDTSAGRLTLLHAYSNGNRSWRDWALGPFEFISQRWEGLRLMRGAHISASSKFTYAGFSAPQLIHWLGPSHLNYHARGREAPLTFTRDEPGPRFEAETAETFVALGVGASGSRGWRVDNWEAHALYDLEAPQRLTVRQFSHLALRLATLHAIVMNTPLEFESFRTWDDATPEGGIEVTEVEARESVWNPRAGPLKDPFFDTWDIDFPTFIPRWLEIADSEPYLIGFATPREPGASVETMLLEACNGIEALASQITPTPSLTEEEEEVLRRLREAGVNHKQRRDYSQFLNQRKSTLQSKLVTAASLLGRESAGWLLGDNLEHWAASVAKLRNSITHALSLPEQLGQDPTFVGIAERSASVVLRLAMLRHAGYTNPRAGSHGELLVFEGRIVAGHPNSDLFQECDEVASYAQQWAGWHERVTRTVSTNR